jgi:transglutaminase-like putative cysteine protease
VTAPAASARRPLWLRLPSTARTAAVSATVAIALRALPFFALCAMATMHWSALIEPARTGRGLLVAVIATSVGVLIALSARIPAPAGTVVRVLVIVAGLALAIGAVGIRMKLLLPSGWGTLQDRISGGLSAVGSVGEWPYAGPNVWLRLTTLLAAPLAAILAAVAVFWPTRRSLSKPAGLRVAGLALLLTLYGVAVAARQFGHQGLRGAGLLLAIAAWLWLPRLRGRDAVMASIAIVITGLLALGLTAKVASKEPWVDYRHWSWTLHHERTVTFDWRHTYGPLHWPRKGTTLLLIKSKEPHYWRAETLERFDGYHWTTNPERNAALNAAEIVDPNKKSWNETVKVTVRGLRSQLVIGPGTIYDLGDRGAETITLSNGTYVLSGKLGSGDTYTARGYVPDPTARQMRAAPPPDRMFSPYTNIELPPGGGFPGASITVPLRGSPLTGTRGAAQQIEASVYAPMYRLAKRVTAGDRTDYDAVKSIGAWLEGHYGYSEHVHNHAYPLEAFLFEDKAGYCQQFAGTAALMLRMLGIPARVAGGFTPGTFNTETKEYVVRDLDAHSWIEVWFQGIGWVPFDPTPALAPASSQSATLAATSAARGDISDRLPKKKLDALLGPRPDSATTASGQALAKNEGTPWGLIALLSAIVILLATAVFALVRRRRAHRRALPLPCGDPDVDHLVMLLARLGLDVSPQTTLFALEGRLKRLGGPDAAAYAARLRERRFGGNGITPPTRHDRRHLRRIMAEAVEAGPLTRLHLALPDNPVQRLRAFKLARIQRIR